MIITAASEMSDLMWIYLLKLKWVSNKALVNLALSVLKISFVILVNTKDNLYSSFFIFLINSCKSAAILK